MHQFKVWAPFARHMSVEAGGIPYAMKGPTIAIGGVARLKMQGREPTTASCSTTSTDLTPTRGLNGSRVA